MSGSSRADLLLSAQPSMPQMSANPSTPQISAQPSTPMLMRNNETNKSSVTFLQRNGSSASNNGSMLKLQKHMQSITNIKSFRQASESRFSERAAEVLSQMTEKGVGAGGGGGGGRGLTMREREKLENTLLDNKIITDKLKRRDAMIMEMRQIVRIDLVQSTLVKLAVGTQASIAALEVQKKKQQDFAGNEEVLVLKLQDEIDALKRYLEASQGETKAVEKRWKRELARNKDNAVLFEKNEVQFFDRLKELERERNGLHTAMSNKEHMIERVMRQFEEVSQQLGEANTKIEELNIVLLEAKAEVDYKEKDRLSMQESLDMAVQAKLKAEAEAKQVVTNTTAQREENLDLRRRYELLVGELDELVRNNVFADKPSRVVVEYHSDSSSEEEDEEEDNTKSFSSSGKRTKTEKVKDDSKRLEKEERRRLRRERREKRRADAAAEAARHARKGRMLGNARDLVSFDEEEEAEESDEEVKNISFPHVTPAAPKVVEQKVQQAPPPQKVQQVQQQQHEASVPTLPLGLGIYAQSKLDQDALAQERLLTSSLVRQVFSLETEMASIKVREEKLKAAKEEEREAALAKESDLQRRRISLQAEVNRLASDNRELLNALQVAKSEAKSNRDILLANRGSNNMSSSARFSRYGSTSNAIAGASPSPSTAEFAASGSGHFKGQESTANLNSRFDATAASSRQGAEVKFASVSEIRGLESVPKKEDVAAARKSMILDPEAWSNLGSKSKDHEEDDDDDNVVQNTVVNKMATSNVKSAHTPTSISAKPTAKDTLRGRIKSEPSSKPMGPTVERFAAGNVQNLMKKIVVEETLVEEEMEEEELGRDEVAERKEGNALVEEGEEEEDYFASAEDQEQGREEETGGEDEDLTDVERRAKMRILYGESSSSGRDDYEFFSVDKDCQTENLVTLDQNTSTLPNLCEYPQEESLLKIFRALRALTRWQIPTTDFAVPSQTQFGEDTEDQLRFFISKSTHPNGSTATTVAGDDSSLRCRKILTYIYHANSMRNRLVREISERPTWDTGGSRIFVRCLDLVIQSIHFLVTGGVPATVEGAGGALGEQTGNNNNDEEENVDGSRIQLEGATAEIARCYAAFEQEEKWHATSNARNANKELVMNDDISSSMQNQRAMTADARVRFWNKKKRNHSPTNRLVETVFPNVEAGSGSPRGVLGKYMNRSLQPRQLVNEDVDALLSFNEEAAEIAQAAAARRQRGRSEKANKDMNLELMWSKGVIDGEDEYTERAPYKSSPSASPAASRSPSPHKQGEGDEGGREVEQRPLLGSQEVQDMQEEKDGGNAATAVMPAAHDNDTDQSGWQKPVEEEDEEKQEKQAEEEERGEDATDDDDEEEEEEMEGKTPRPMYAKRREGLTGLSLLTGEREASDSYVVQPSIKTHLNIGTNVDDGGLKIMPVQEGIDEFHADEIGNVDDDGGDVGDGQRGGNENWYGQWDEKSGEIEVSLFHSAVLQQKDATMDASKEEKLVPPPTVESDFLHRRLLQKKQHQQFLVQQEEQRKQWLLWQEQTGLSQHQRQKRKDGGVGEEEEVDLYFGEGKDEVHTGLARQGKHEPMRQADVITINLATNGNGNKSRKDATLSLSPSLSEAITYAQLMYFESNKTRKIYSVPLVGVPKDAQAKELRGKDKKGVASDEEDVSSAFAKISQRPGTSIPLRPSVPKSSANRNFKQRPTTTGGSKELFETKDRLAQTGSPPPPLGQDLWRSHFELKATAAIQEESKLRTASVDGLALNLLTKKSAQPPSSPTTPHHDEKKKIVVNLTSSVKADSFFVSRPLLPSAVKPRAGLKLD